MIDSDYLKIKQKNTFGENQAPDDTPFFVKK